LGRKRSEERGVKMGVLGQALAEGTVFGERHFTFVPHHRMGLEMGNAAVISGVLYDYSISVDR